jgi:RNA polymerase sigma-70 factor (ECF subfamily)
VTPTESDRPSLDDLVSAYGPALWRLTRAYARNDVDREDLYQEILVAAWRALPRFRGDASLRTFVYRIGHNRGLTFRARSDRRARREYEIPLEYPDPAAPPGHALERTREQARLAAAIGALSPTLAQVVILHLEELSHAEIAQVLGITPNNVAVRLNRARNELAGLLTRNEEASA